jgi:hypothetical protein
MTCKTPALQPLVVPQANLQSLLQIG